MKPKILTIRKGILDANDRQAAALRDAFTRTGVLVLNVVSSPGSGKTTLLTVLARHLIDRGITVSAVVGDLATDNDARRLRESGAAAYQINTNGNCHLDARMVQDSLDHVPWKRSEVLIIENVGNLVCPAGFDLGEHLRVVMMSVTEGEDKPLKYPVIFRSSDICVISKIDLAPAVGYDRDITIGNIRKVNPLMTILETSASTESGIREFADHLLAYRKAVFSRKTPRHTHTASLRKR